MKRIERNLLLSTQIAVEETEYQIELNHQDVAQRKLAIAETFLKVLKMISCKHDTKHGHTTGIMWHQAYIPYTKIKVESWKEVTKRCHNCNQVFYRKKYNLLGRKKK